VEIADALALDQRVRTDRVVAGRKRRYLDLGAELVREDVCDAALLLVHIDDDPDDGLPRARHCGSGRLRLRAHNRVLDGEKAVPSPGDDVSAVLPDGRPQEAVVAGEGVGEPRPELIDEPRRSLDVLENERQRPRGHSDMGDGRLYRLPLRRSEEPASSSRPSNKEAPVAPIVQSVEIARSPDEVFAYLTDFSHATEWQENLVSADVEGEGPFGVGSRVKMTRRIGNSERTMTTEVIEHDPPRSWAFRGIDGPIRAKGKGTVEPVGDGTSSRFTMELDFEGRGIGMLLVPLVVRRQARSDVAKSQAKLKERLEGGASA
jgi:uncharacterized protein YndB with AHSA1/START domain